MPTELVLALVVRAHAATSCAGFNGSGNRLVISNGGQVATARYAYVGYSS